MGARKLERLEDIFHLPTNDPQADESGLELAFDPSEDPSPRISGKWRRRDSHVHSRITRSGIVPIARPSSNPILPRPAAMPRFVVGLRTPSLPSTPRAEDWPVRRVFFAGLAVLVLSITSAYFHYI
jgi:hypothetical protein